MLTSILTGVFSSLVASLLFLALLSRVRPKVLIAPAVAKTTTKDGRVLYSIKIINRTRWPIVNVRARMTLATLRYVKNGPIFDQNEIKLRTREIMEIPKFVKNEERARYAIQFQILDDLDEKWDDGSSPTELRFQIYATHSFTGFGKASEVRFFDKASALKAGAYAAGNTFTIS